MRLERVVLVVREDVLTVEFFKLDSGQKVGPLTEPRSPLVPFNNNADMVKWCKQALANRREMGGSNRPHAVRLLQFGKEIYQWTEWHRLAEINNRRILRVKPVEIAKRVKELRDEIQDNLDKIENGTHILAPAPPLSTDELKRTMEDTVEDLTKTLERYGKE